MSDTCPTCKQNMPHVIEPVRVCLDCQKPIVRGHKWMLKKVTVYFKGANMTATVIVHRHCSSPFEYHARQK